MRLADRVAAILLLLFSAAYTAVAVVAYPYWGSSGPASGFLPRWLGLAMGVLALLLLLGSRRARSGERRWLPEGPELRKQALLVALTALFVAALPATGMILGTALFLAVVLGVLEQHRWSTVLGVAVGTAALNYLVFTHWLRVPFPTGLLGF